MTEQTASETPVVEQPTAAPVVEPQKRFRFTRKQVAIGVAATTAAVVAIAVKVKSAASKADNENPEALEAETSETDSSV